MMQEINMLRKTGFRDNKCDDKCHCTQKHINHSKKKNNYNFQLKNIEIICGTKGLGTL